MRLHTEYELRHTQPFSSDFKSLIYIGVVKHETWNVEEHVHEHFELCYMENGQGIFTVNAERYPVNKGHMFLTKPGEIHRGMAVGYEPICLFYLGFDMEPWRRLELCLYEIGLNRVGHDSEGKINPLLMAIFSEIESSEAHNQLMILGLLTQLVVTVSRIYKTIDRDEAKVKIMKNKVIETVRYLQNHVRLDHSIQSLADRLHVSVPYLSREFKKYVGMSIGKYIKQLCLEKAKYQLKESEETVSAIAESLNFSSVHSFSLFFKRHTELSPQQYRR